MSVIQSKRGESKVQFVYNAFLLERHTYQTCARFPQRYRFSLAQDMIVTANKIHKCAREINRIFPRTKEDYGRRAELIEQALGELDNIANQIHLTADLVSFKKNKEYKIGRWCELVDDEIRLLKGLRKSDREKKNKL